MDWGYLICPAERWQLSGWVLDEGEDRSVPWSGRIPIQASICNSLERQRRRSSYPRPPWAASAHPSPALSSLPLFTCLLVCQPALVQLFFYLSWATRITNYSYGTQPPPGLSLLWHSHITSPGLVPGVSAASLWCGYYLPLFRQEEIIK